MNVRLLGSRVLWGALLVAAGILFLLQNIGVITFAGIIWAVLFALVGIFILSYFLIDRNNWWALIPGIILLDLALLIALGVLAPASAGTVGGALFLAGISLSFWLVYLFRRDFWWAVIPAGTMLTLAGVVVVGSLGYEMESGGVFLIGLGLTFALLGVIPTQEGNLRWAWIPAAVLLVIGLSLMFTAFNLANLILPLILILIGLFLIYRTFIRRNA